MQMRYTFWEKVFGGFEAVNFLTFFVADFWLGGDALNGKAVNGYYFLNSHGTYTEVSHGVFVYSLVHATVLFASAPLAFLVSRRAMDRNKQQI